MLLLMSKRFTRLFIENGAAEEDEEVYIYGMQILLSSFFTFLAVLLAAVLFGITKEVLCYLTVFVLLRRSTGGYHAKKFWSCCMITVITTLLSVCLGIFADGYNRTLLFGLFAAAILLIFLLAPVTNKNRPVTAEELHRSRFIARIWCISAALLVVICEPGYFAYWTTFIMMAFASVGIALLVEQVNIKKERIK